MTELEHLIAIQTRLERIEILLKKEHEDDMYMTITEASNYTRFSVATLRRAIESGDLSCVSQGGRGGKMIFKKSALTEWLEK
jgi:excisionase family DNA binding protein